MPLNGAGTASKPANTAAIAGQTIESAKFNSVIDDLYQIFNTARPVAYGGTGGTTPAEARTNLGLEIGNHVQAYSAALTALASAFTAASASGAASLALAEDTDNGSNKVTLQPAAALGGDRVATLPDKTGTIAMTSDIVEVIIISVVPENTVLTTGTAKRTFRMPFALTLSAVRASVSTASSSGLPTVDINEGGGTILSTKLTIDANELTSTTAATAAVISDVNLADDAEITIDIDVAGTGAKGLKVTLYGTRP